MSGDWQKALHPGRDRRGGGRPRRTMGGMEEVFGAKLREFTTIGVGGGAERLVFPRSVREVQDLLAAECAAGRKSRALGAGSNLLVSDGGVRGTVVCLKKNMCRVLVTSEGKAVADGGVTLPRLSVLCALSSLSGAEELSGIPGTVGGALTMNAGAFGRAVGEIVEWVEIVDGSGALHRIAGKEIRFSYREAEYPVRGIIVRAGFRLRPGSSDAAFSRMKVLNERRRAGQPWGVRTFGSTFRNPAGAERAAALLDRAGMKGAREGDAMFSERHANFMINAGKATASDVVLLMERGREAVRAQAGITLATEVKMWGFGDD